MKNKGKKILSIMLAWMLLVSVQSISVQAANYTSRSLVKLNAVYTGYTATSNTSTVTVGSTTSTKNAKITSIVITSTKSTSSVGTLTLHVKNNTTGYSDSMPWEKSVTFTGLNGSCPVGSYSIYFTGYNSTGGVGAATLSAGTIKIYYK